MPTQTFVFDKPYSVEKIQAPKGKKVKNVILMIGDGMSLMHVYTAWTANRGHLWLENAQYTGLSKTWCTDPWCATRALAARLSPQDIRRNTTPWA